jgi:hypothetical protein
MENLAKQAGQMTALPPSPSFPLQKEQHTDTTKGKRFFDTDLPCGGLHGGERRVERLQHMLGPNAADATSALALLSAELTAASLERDR